MRLLIQRVKKAKVVTLKAKKNISQIGSGLFVLVGIEIGDNYSDADRLIDKILKLRILADEKGKMNFSLMDKKADLLLVSQFTLVCDTNNGNRPSFINAEEPKKAFKIYQYLIEKLKEKKIHFSTGSFGEYMRIDAVLDGPVTIAISSRKSD